MVDLGVGQDGGLLHVHGDSLAHVLNRGGHVEVEGHGLGLLHALLHAGVGGGGVIPNHVCQGGAALAQSLVRVGLLQLSPLVGHNHALDADHAEHVAQNGTVVGIGQRIAVLILLDHLHVHGVVDQQSRVVAVQRSAHVLVEVAEDAKLVGQGGGVQRPVIAHQALDLSLVAQRGQQHLGGLHGGHVGGGVEGAIAAAGNDAKGVAVVDVALGPVGADISQAAVDVHVQIVTVLVVAQHDGDHLRHLSAVYILAGRIGTIGLALDDLQRGEHGNRILVHDLSAVGEIVVAHSGSADNHHADEHGGSQHQAESPFEVSHLGFSSF